MMQSRQNRCRHDSVARGDLMWVRPRGPVERQVGNARSETGMWSTVVILSHPLLQDRPKMGFIQQNQPIQTLPTDRINQPLAERVRLRAVHGRLQHRQAHCVNGAVYGRRIDAVAVVNEKSVLRHIPMHDPTPRA